MTQSRRRAIDENNKKGRRRASSDSTNHNIHHGSSLEYEGERLASLLQSITKSIESARHVAGNSLPHKIWLKQQFSIGVNEVTRVLERMKPNANDKMETPNKVSPVQLQAILLASDCNPRWLTKHLPSLALSRKVPMIFLKDNKGASLRLGELVKLKTVIAIGVKAKGNFINQLLAEILGGNSSSQQCDDVMSLVTDGLNSSSSLKSCL